MYNTACVASAGRAVLEMVQFDWEPLSHGELDQRLDHAVEEILEAELIEKARAVVGPTYVLQAEQAPQFQQAEGPAHAQQLELQLSQSQQIQLPSNTEEDNRAVKYVTDLLQNSDSSYNRKRLTGRARLSLPHTVLLSLTLLRRRLSYRSVSSRFRVEKGNIHRVFFSFCERVNALAAQQIRWPAGQEAGQNLDFLSGAESLESPGIPKVFGILGSTRIPIRLPIGKQRIEGGLLEVKKMRKEVHPDSWLNLELVCDRQGKFLHCRISKGSDTDKASSLKQELKLNPHMLPEGSCLVARTGYPLSGQILTPYPTCACPREYLYNQTLEPHLDVFDQAVVQLKSRFQRLWYLDMGNFERARAVVLTACVLHNVFLQMGDGEGDAVPERTETEEREDEGEGETEEEGVRKREAIADLLYREREADGLKCVWEQIVTSEGERRTEEGGEGLEGTTVNTQQ
ncbi:putative nuclease HARBI1 isoform X2 [Anguilla rostrata]